jgi:hypothetical protein
MVNPQDHEAMTHGEEPTLSKSAAEFNSANGAESAARPRESGIQGKSY